MGFIKRFVIGFAVATAFITLIIAFFLFTALGFVFFLKAFGVWASLVFLVISAGVAMGTLYAIIED